MMSSSSSPPRYLLVAGRCRFPAVSGHGEVFTPEFCAIVAELHSRFSPRVSWARATRLSRVKAAVENGTMPGPLPPSLATTSDWKVPPLPPELRQPGIEISGPARYERRGSTTSTRYPL